MAPASASSVTSKAAASSKCVIFGLQRARPRVSAETRGNVISRSVGRWMLRFAQLARTVGRSAGLGLVVIGCAIGEVGEVTLLRLVHGKQRMFGRRCEVL